MATVLITGANRGIGLALTKKYIENGDKVIATCRKSSEGLNTSGAIVYENIDVTDEQAFHDLGQKIPEIDILINNAGILRSDQLDTVDYDILREQFEVNTLGPLKVVKELLSKLHSKSKIGILTSRMGSIEDNTSGGQYGYRLTKSAANSIGKSLAEDLREEGITVLLLHPGYVKTEMTGGRGLIETDESAEGLFKLLNEKTLEDTGTFWHTSGEQLKW